MMRQMMRLPKVLDFALIGAVALGCTTAQLMAQDLIETHAISTFGTPKYTADFAHLDYVNPDAPQGGEMSFSWSSGTFDSLHPYTRVGNSAVLATIFFESLLTSTADEIGSAYCLLCETMRFPPTRDYVIFNLRDEAEFSDGTPVTADDVLFSYEILRDEGLPSFRASLPMTIESAEVLGPREIKFTFNPESPCVVGQRRQAVCPCLAAPAMRRQAWPLRTAA